MKATRLFLATSILVGIFFLNGCEKTGVNLGGQAVRFNASAQTGPSTKTEYSGEGTIANGFLTWERINWLPEDHIRVASNYAYLQDPGDGGLSMGIHYADYALGDIQIKAGDPTRSVAVMKPYIVAPPYFTGSNGLVWDDNHAGGYIFYAVYPCPFENSNISLGSGDDGTTLGEVTATIPAGQVASGTKTRYTSASGAVADASGIIYSTVPAGGLTYTVYQPDMSYAFMSAAVSGVAANTDGVTLVFNPAYTAFEFHITTEDAEPLTISKISLTATGSDDYLAGEYSFTSGSDFNMGTPEVSITTTGAQKTVSMALSDASINQTEGIAATLFAIPKTNAGALKLTLVTSEGTASLPFVDASKNPVQFDGGKKYRINLLKVRDTWKFFASVEEMSYSGYNIINF